MPSDTKGGCRCVIVVLHLDVSIFDAMESLGSPSAALKLLKHLSSDADKGTSRIAAKLKRQYTTDRKK